MKLEHLDQGAFINSETLRLPDTYPFPYQPESFTDEEKLILGRFFTNVDRPVFAIHGLPEEVIGAMFSRYSRTEASVRRVFLNEFWKTPELGLQSLTDHMVATSDMDLQSAQERARKLYHRIFADFGDDSVIQMGSVHIAFEYVSQIASKAIEDGRIAAAYIEKSTRYVDFGSEVSGHFLFMEEPSIMASGFAGEYTELNKDLFEAYKRHMLTTREVLRGKYRLEDQVFVNQTTGEEIAYDQIANANDRQLVEKAYEKALKAKTLDTIRVFLPATTVTNLGAHFSGQAAESAVNKMLASQHPEVRLLGALAYYEVNKVAPSFFENVDHRYGAKTREYLAQARELQQGEVEKWVCEIQELEGGDVRLVDFDIDADVKVAAQIIYTSQGDRGLSKEAIFQWVRAIKERDSQEHPELKYSPRLAELILSATQDRLASGLNRRHKLPRAFEHAFAEVEFDVNFGIYRDVQRNRMSSTERQMLTADNLFIPQEFGEPGMEAVLGDYLSLAEKTRVLNTRLRESGDKKLAAASEYVTLFGNTLRFNIKANLRQWVFFSELRTIAGGHPDYRRAMQKAVRQIVEAMPWTETLFAHIDWTDDYGLGRLKAEIRTASKLADLDDTRN